MNNTLSILFWNIKGNNKRGGLDENKKTDKMLGFEEQIDILNFKFKPDIIAIAESNPTIISKIKSLGFNKNEFVPNGNKQGLSLHWLESDNFLIRNLKSPYHRLQFLEARSRFNEEGVNADPILIVMVHLLDARNYQRHEDRLIYAIRMRKFIDEIRKKRTREHGLDNLMPTIIVGDFNMNPFDRGMTALDGFASVPSSAWLPHKGLKVSHGQKFHAQDYFINPGWLWLLHEKPGTYYYQDAFSVIQHHVVDQIIFSPALEPMITDCHPIFEDGVLKPLEVSDHLPIFAKIDFSIK